MCTILVFPDESSKLKALFNEATGLDSVLFIFNGSRRYRFSASSLGLECVSDLLLPLGSGLFRSSPFWAYYVYPRCSNFNRGLSGLCGEILSKSGLYLAPNTCHVFINRSRRGLKILYQRQGEYIVEHRQLSSGLYQLEKSERGCTCLSISWTRLNQLLTVHQKNRTKPKVKNNTTNKANKKLSKTQEK